MQNFIDGKAVDAADGRRSDLIDPTTGEVFGSSPISAAEDVDAAYRGRGERLRDLARHHADASGSARCCKFADAMEDRAEEIIAAECQNTGKPIELTRTEEMPPAIDQIRFFAGAARLLEGRSAGEYMAGHTSYIRREPVGVVGPGRRRGTTR